jgi:heme/copper-type cytochrome/quinol oxidase subunit 3
MNTHVDGVVIEPEPLETIPSNMFVGTRLAASAVVFLFMSFVFAFFYLRALNTAHSFLMPHVDPPVGWGVAILVCVVASAAIVSVVRKEVVDGTESRWRAGMLAASLLSFAVIVLQLIEYYNLTFGAADGGLASVFFGFTAIYGVLWLAAVYWIETLWAQSMRQLPAPEGHAGAPGRLLRPSADACVVYLYTMAVAEVFAFVCLYLIK